MLTIAIPTRNRAALLDRQLAWLASAIQGHEHELELVVSDNCSTDGTDEVLARWQSDLGTDQLQVRRQSQDVGAIRNIASCILAARQPYVWTISDDDEIRPCAVAQVLDRLRRHEDLALLQLNFSSRYVNSGRLRFARCYEVPEERMRSDGATAFLDLFAHNTGGVALTTALVYRTELAKEAIRRWGEEALDNLAVQIYWTGYCAAQGSVLVTEQSLLECAAGRHFFLDDPSLHMQLRYADLPEVALRLTELGYPWEVTREVVLSQLRRVWLTVAWQGWKHDPRRGTWILVAYATVLARVGLPTLARHLAGKVRSRVHHLAGKVRSRVQLKIAGGDEGD